MKKRYPFVQSAEKAHQKQFETKAAVAVRQFSNNGVMTRGIFDIPAIGFGPGQEEHAHKVQDQVKEADLVKAQEFHAAFVLEWAHADKQAVDH